MSTLHEELHSESEEEEQKEQEPADDVTKQEKQADAPAEATSAQKSDLSQVETRAASSKEAAPAPVATQLKQTGEVTASTENTQVGPRYL